MCSTTSFESIKSLERNRFGPPKHNVLPLKHNVCCIFTMETWRRFLLIIYEFFFVFSTTSFESIKSLGHYRLDPQSITFYLWNITFTIFTIYTRRRFFAYYYRVFSVLSTTSFESIKSLATYRFGPPKHNFLPLEQYFYCIFTIETWRRFFADYLRVFFCVFDYFIGVDKKPRSL